MTTGHLWGTALSNLSSALMPSPEQAPAGFSQTRRPRAAPAPRHVVSGQDHSEHNFGWNITEGNHCFQHDTCEKTGFTPAVADYPHEEGCSVTGGVTYRGKALPMLNGRYFYADYCTGLLRSFVWTRDASTPTAPG